MISLSFMIRLISPMRSELTHTAPYKSLCILGEGPASKTYSLCESGNHSGNWNCSHSVLRRCDRRRGFENRILNSRQLSYSQNPNEALYIPRNS